MNSLRPDLFTAQEIALNKEVQNNPNDWRVIYSRIIDKFGPDIDPDNIVLSIGDIAKEIDAVTAEACTLFIPIAARDYVLIRLLIFVELICKDDPNITKHFNRVSSYLKTGDVKLSEIEQTERTLSRISGEFLSIRANSARATVHAIALIIAKPETSLSHVCQVVMSHARKMYIILPEKPVGMTYEDRYKADLMLAFPPIRHAGRSVVPQIILDKSVEEKSIPLDCNVIPLAIKMRLVAQKKTNVDICRTIIENISDHIREKSLIGVRELEVVIPFTMFKHMNRNECVDMILKPFEERGYEIELNGRDVTLYTFRW